MRRLYHRTTVAAAVQFGVSSSASPSAIQLPACVNHHARPIFGGTCGSSSTSSPAGGGSFDSLLHHNMALNVLDDTATPMRKVRVVCTIGPSSVSEDVLEQLIRVGGMNVARLNFSHGSHDYHANSIRAIRNVAAKFPQYHLGIALDTKGPEIRLGAFARGDEVVGHPQQKNLAVTYAVGQKVTVTTDEKFRDAMTRDLLFIDYKPLALNASDTPERILVADGVLELQVLSRRSPTELECVVACEATIGSHCNVNLPQVTVDLPAISEKDMRDLEFAASQKLDFVFASFARCASHIVSIRELLASKGSEAAIIAKIENHTGIRNLTEILSACDGMMVARGDLGVALPPERVFLAQKKMISECNLAAKPVICATQMLESMTANPRPTRAEVADVANAVIDGTDAVMLSAETASGAFPVRAAQTISSVSMTAFNYIRHAKRLTDVIQHDSSRSASGSWKTTPINSTGAAAVLLSQQNAAKCIVTLTVSGNSVRQLRRYGASCPIVAVCVSAQRARWLSLVRGVIPLYFEDVDYSDFDKLALMAIDFLREPQVCAGGLKLEVGDSVVVSCTDPDVSTGSFETFVRIHTC